MEWSAASHIAAIIFYVIGIGLVVTSQVAVAWVGYDSVRMYGLYQRCAGSLCQNIEWTTDLETLEFFICRIILLLADACVIAGFLAALIALCLREKQKKVAIITAGSCNIVAAIAVWGGAGAFTAINILLLPNSADQTYRYSFGLCWAAGFVFFMGGMLDILNSASEVGVLPSEPVVKRIQTVADSQAPPPYSPTFDTTPPVHASAEKFSY